ncbi:MAG: cohesin domain-containing protein, partial [Candidatus Thermoplasmatota archaeon]|nr:cohesin domain-containing protein [Candidatus Thermoplasmatota archaeon]
MKKIVLLLTFIAFFIPLAVAAEGTSISLLSPPIVVVGNEFYVDVTAQNLISFSAANYSIHYNPSLFEIEEMYNGSIDGTDIPLIYSVNNDTGICRVVQNAGLQGI